MKLPTSKHHIKGSAALLLLKFIFFGATTELLYFILLALILLTPIFSTYSEPAFIVLSLAFFVKIIFETFVIFRTLISWASTSYYLSENYLVKHVGVIKIQEDIYELKNIRTIHRDQSWIGKKFHYGTLTLELAYFGYNKKIKLLGIRNPKKYQKILEESLGSPQPPVSDEPHVPFDNTEL